MGVSTELLGKQVRCPHCKQVLVAPSTVGPSPAPAVPAPLPSPKFDAPPPPVPIPPPAPVQESDLPVFKAPARKEGADSILSEPDESEDEVFGTSPSKRPAIVVPDIVPPTMTLTAPQTVPVTAPPPAAPEPPPANPFAFAPSDPNPAGPPAPAHDSPPDNPFADMSAPAARVPAPAVAPPLLSQTAPPEPTVGSTNPFANVGPAGQQAEAQAPQAAPPPPQVPVLFPAGSQPIAAPRPAPVAPPPAQPSDPFADLTTTKAPATAVTEVKKPTTPVPEELPADEPPRKRKKRDSAPDASAEEPAGGLTPAPLGSAKGARPTALIAVGVYAFLATIVAVYGLFFKSGEKLEPGHPLSTVPDNFGEFDPAARKKVSLYRFNVDGELPADQRAGLGGKITVGQMDVHPLRIEKRRLAVVTEPVKGDTRTEATPAALVLTLRVKNNFEQSIYPMDPAFTRRSVGDDRPITRLVVNKTTVLPGGALTWPPGAAVRKQYEQQQANDYTPLGPGETRDYVVFTDFRAQAQKLIRAAEESPDMLQWRVQIRRAPVKFRGREIPVTAVVGVDFKASDVKEPEEKAPAKS